MTDFDPHLEAIKTVELALANAYKRRRRYPNQASYERDLMVWNHVRDLLGRDPPAAAQPGEAVGWREHLCTDAPPGLRVEFGAGLAGARARVRIEGETDLSPVSAQFAIRFCPFCGRDLMNPK